MQELSVCTVEVYDNGHTKCVVYGSSQGSRLAASISLESRNNNLTQTSGRQVQELSVCTVEVCDNGHTLSVLSMSAVRGRVSPPLLAWGLATTT